jgi:hypothetical protein
VLDALLEAAFRSLHFLFALAVAALVVGVLVLAIDWRRERRERVEAVDPKDVVRREQRALARGERCHYGVPDCRCKLDHKQDAWP